MFEKKREHTVEQTQNLFRLGKFNFKKYYIGIFTNVQINTNEKSDVGFM